MRNVAEFDANDFFEGNRSIRFMFEDHNNLAIDLHPFREGHSDAFPPLGIFYLNVKTGEIDLTTYPCDPIVFAEQTELDVILPEDRVGSDSPLSEILGEFDCGEGHVLSLQLEGGTVTITLTCDEFSSSFSFRLVDGVLNDTVFVKKNADGGSEQESRFVKGVF